MRALRNILIIILIIVLVLFILTGVGNGFFDKIKGAFTISFSGDVYDLNNGDYMVRSKNKAAFVDNMLEKGWNFLGIEGTQFEFIQAEQLIAFEEHGFLGFFTVYELVES